ncbi:hypothetical protein ACB092_08G189600 [Castanea dentata]
MECVNDFTAEGQNFTIKENEIARCFFLTISSVFFVGFLFTAFISKLLPPFDHALLSSIQNDWYYCFLVPLTFPVLVVAVYFHWLSMKLFKHAWLILSSSG